MYDPVLMKDSPEKQRHPVRWISSGVAAIAACFLLFFGLSYYQSYMQTYSSIYLTINPQVQIDLNQQGIVVGLTGTNPDGRQLLEGYDGKGKDKATVADELVDRAIEMGFLSEGGWISFSIDVPDDDLFQEYRMELFTEITKHLEGRLTINIEIFRSTSQQSEHPVQSHPSAASSPDAGSLPAVSSAEFSGRILQRGGQPFGTGSRLRQRRRGRIFPPLPGTAPIPSEPGPGSVSGGGADLPSPSSTAPIPSEPDPGSGSGGGADLPSPSSTAPIPPDTDYGPGSDGVTDLTPPPADPIPPDTGEGTSDYGDGNSNYGGSNYSAGDSGYEEGRLNFCKKISLFPPFPRQSPVIYVYKTKTMKTERSNSHETQKKTLCSSLRPGGSLRSYAGWVRQ